MKSVHEALHEALHEVMPTHLYYWRYNYNLVFKFKHNEKDYVINGLNGYGLLATVEDKFPEEKLSAVVSVGAQNEDVILSYHGIDKTEYERLRVNDINDFLGTLQRLAQEEEFRKALTQEQSIIETPEEPEEEIEEGAILKFEDYKPDVVPWENEEKKGV